VADFKTEYSKLNPEQKKAVDTIEGPVLVVAGAGTGKTQVIAMRIGKILKETQINPSNILCLTFTDNAALNMRSRLLSLIGPSANSVRISTFHAFCQSAIRGNPEYFFQFSSDSEPLDKIEQIQIIRHLIDILPPDSPLKTPNDTYYYQGALISAIESLKKENVSPPLYQSLVSIEGDFFKSIQPFYDKLKSITAYPKNLNQIVSLIDEIIHLKNLNSTYQTKISSLLKNLSFAKDLKSTLINFYENIATQYPRHLALSEIFPGYQQELLIRHRFDFDDMILSVIDALKCNPALLSSYQEKFQYILVDEFQDTSASQNEIITLLCSGQDSPNIFVVGDDDQSIFRFQGASVENVYNFYQTYKSSPIVLRNNYRSHRLILDSTASLISRNQNRIAQQIKGIDKSLIATRKYDPNPINLYVAESQIEENFWIVSKIKKLIDSGTTPQNIAILFRNNADIIDLLPPLSALKIKYVKDFGTNILSEPLILQLLDLLKLLSHPDDQILKNKVLNFSFLHLPSLSLYHYFRDPTSSKISAKFKKHLAKFKKQLTRFQKLKANLPPDKLFNHAIRRFKYLKYILKHKNIEALKQLNRLYSEFKIQRSAIPLSFDEIVARLLVYTDNSLSLVSPPLLSDNPQSIRLLTVHKAKGLEFEHVFLIKNLAIRWEGARGQNKITPPLGILRSEPLSADTDLELEENRRLFYVALTRAKNQIYLSRTLLNPEGREQPPTRFLSEIDPQFVEIQGPDSEIEVASLKSQFSLKETKIQSADLHDYLKYFFTYYYRINISHINSYRKCPFCFFINTILRLPKSKNKSLSFGTSVHGALAYLFTRQNLDPKIISLNDFLKIFDQNLARELLTPTDFTALSKRGHDALTAYYQRYLKDFKGKYLVEHDFKPYLANIDNIPITGKIDKIEILTGKNVNVVDFKTGTPDNKYKELKPDGDYFRQLVFYKILADHSPGFGYQVVSGTIDFIETKTNGSFAKYDFKITPEAIADMEKVIRNVYHQITSFKFTPGADCSDPDHLHHLFGKYFKS
jgi:DNA helicase-2/ATP-dependent DNA helicase PcrA